MWGKEELLWALNNLLGAPQGLLPPLVMFFSCFSPGGTEAGTGRSLPAGDIKKMEQGRAAPRAKPSSSGGISALLCSSLGEAFFFVSRKYRSTHIDALWDAVRFSDGFPLKQLRC